MVWETQNVLWLKSLKKPKDTFSKKKKDKI